MGVLYRESLCLGYCRVTENKRCFMDYTGTENTLNASLRCTLRLLYGQPEVLD